MVANRLPNVRATVYYGPAHETFLHRIFSQKHYDIIALSREHNDANILSLGARFMSVEQAKKAVNTWLKIPFAGEERHNRRIYKIDHKL
jgi:ribose 5-phosphate isomerase B